MDQSLTLFFFSVEEATTNCPTKTEDEIRVLLWIGFIRRWRSTQPLRLQGNILMPFPNIKKEKYLPWTNGMSLHSAAPNMNLLYICPTRVTGRQNTPSRKSDIAWKQNVLLVPTCKTKSNKRQFLEILTL